MAPRSSSITKRWLFNSFGIIVVIMVAMVIGVSAAMHSFYYNSASQYIRTRAAAISTQLEAAAADAGSDFNSRLYQLVQDFEYKDRIELMALDAEGYDIRAHVHDEVIVTEPLGGRSVEEMSEIMGRPIPWAPGLPLRADGYSCPFYQKD